MILHLASGNRHKAEEMQRLADETPASRGLSVRVMPATKMPPVEEDTGTFIGNARKKAMALQATLPADAWVLADDSGVCVDALGGAPGVQSAVYAPFDAAPGLAREARREAQDAANNRMLLERLQGVADRRARFVCALVALRSPADPEPLLAFGRWDGEILAASHGEGGFGYDPLLFIPALGATVAALPAAVKNAHSHRALAAAQMIALMRTAWHLA